MTSCEVDEGFLLSGRVGQYTCVVFRKFFCFFTCRISVPQRGIEPTPPTMEVWTLNH